jgi:prepilin-type N-terminal cleavage/methylation domain-containing protein
MSMEKRTAKSQLGFTLLELMVASVLGVVLVLAMTSLFRQGMNATYTVTQRAEAQENMRAAIELMTKDLGMAGAGLPTGGLQLAYGTGATASKIACNQSGYCYLGATDTYPNSNTMTGIVPGYALGVESNAVITAAPAATNDSITSIYCDYSFPLTNFNFTLASTNSVTLSVVNAATTPNNILAAGGLNVGDLLLFQVSQAGNGTGDQGTSTVTSATVVAEITGLPAGGTTINFAANDPLNFNQASTVSGTFANFAQSNLGTTYQSSNASTTMSVCRLEAVTYFLEVPAAGGTVQTPRLMRQVNGLTAIPVADNITNLQFSYDVIDGSNEVVPNQANPVGAGLSPGEIQKVNMWVMSQSLLNGGNKYQSMYLASSVSARNMSFCNAYSSKGC